MAKVKLGRPPNSGRPPTLRAVSFKLDAETAGMFGQLVEREPNMRGRASNLLRRLIHAEFARIQKLE